MKEKLIVEAIDNNIVKCETEEGEFTYIPLEFLPKEIQEGDIVEKDIQYSIPKDETQRRKELMEEKLNRLLNK